MIVLDLVYKLALLVTFSVISGFISGKFLRKSYLHNSLQGFLFGVASFIGMYHPFIFIEGIIFDGRSVVISLCTLFFGPLAGMITAALALAYRIYLGGHGALMGSMVIIFSFLIGLYFYYRRVRKSNKEMTGLFLYFFGLLVHIVMLILLITLPGEYILETFKTVTITVIGFYPVITVLIGKILTAFDNNRNYINDIRESEQRIILLNQDLEKKVEKRTVQLTEANKELEAFTYTVSHDLRAPLRAIKGFLNYFDEDYSKHLNDDAGKLIQMIRQNADKMGQLIDDLLKFSKYNAVKLNPANVDMHAMANEIFNELTGSESNKPDFICNKLESVNCDASLMRQVWINLISNSIKFSKKNTNASIITGSKRENGMLTYYIEDNGVGFDMKYADKLFNVFQRLHSQREFDGTGAGLAIVKRIIERMGGKVWATGKVNEGATFYFSLPCPEESDLPG